MFGIFTKDNISFRVTQYDVKGFGHDILCGLTLTQALLVVRYINGGTLTGGEKTMVDDLIENNVCPID